MESDLETVIRLMREEISQKYGEANADWGEDVLRQLIRLRQLIDDKASYARYKTEETHLRVKKKTMEEQGLGSLVKDVAKHARRISRADSERLEKIWFGKPLRRLP